MSLVLKSLPSSLICRLLPHQNNSSPPKRHQHSASPSNPSMALSPLRSSPATQSLQKIQKILNPNHNRVPFVLLILSRPMLWSWPKTSTNFGKQSRPLKVPVQSQLTKKQKLKSVLKAKAHEKKKKTRTAISHLCPLNDNRAGKTEKRIGRGRYTKERSRILIRALSTSLRCSRPSSTRSNKFTSSSTKRKSSSQLNKCALPWSKSKPVLPCNSQTLTSLMSNWSVFPYPLVSSLLLPSSSHPDELLHLHHPHRLFLCPHRHSALQVHPNHNYHPNDLFHLVLHLEVRSRSHISAAHQHLDLP